MFIHVYKVIRVLCCGENAGLNTFGIFSFFLFFSFFFPSLTKYFRPEIPDIDGNSQCHGLTNEKTEDVDDEDEELEEEDDDSLTGKSQDETVSPTAEPRGAFEDEEDEEPTSLTMSFDHTRR